MAPSAGCVRSRADPRCSQHLLQLRHTIAIKPAVISLLLHHRIKHIGHRHDPALQGNRITHEPLAIAGAIKALMVVANHIAEHLADHLQPQLHMGIHHLPLLIRERALLKHDQIGNADLADVVQAGETGDLINGNGIGAKAPALSQPLGDQARIVDTRLR